MKQTISYREMVPGDHQALHAMWQATPGLTIRKADSLEGFTFFLERNPGLSFTAEINGRVVGGILGGHDGRFGSIHHLVVQPEFRLKGCGKQLLKQCLEKIEAAGIEKCHVFVNRDNQDGIRFWTNQDWVERVDLRMASFVF